jgi:hypothetical protein
MDNNEKLWGAFFRLGEKSSIIAISQDYRRLPKVINFESKRYLTSKGFSALPEIKAQIELILKDIRKIIDYGRLVAEAEINKTTVHIDIQLMGLNANIIQSILDEAYHIHKRAIDPSVALFGAICKSFWLYCDHIFLPDDMRKVFFKGNFDYYKGALELLTMWNNEPLLEDGPVFIMPGQYK